MKEANIGGNILAIHMNTEVYLHPDENEVSVGLISRAIFCFNLEAKESTTCEARTHGPSDY
jgi:hypothetical protein